jgi:hypothetical protein
VPACSVLHNRITGDQGMQTSLLADGFELPG